MNCLNDDDSYKMIVCVDEKRSKNWMYLKLLISKMYKSKCLMNVDDEMYFLIGEGFINMKINKFDFFNNILNRCDFVLFDLIELKDIFIYIEIVLDCILICNKIIIFVSEKIVFEFFYIENEEYSIYLLIEGLILLLNVYLEINDKL